MIGRIKGEVIVVKPPQVLIEASGVGYELDLPISSCAELPAVGKQVILYTHLVVREDAHSLYGFLNVEMRDCFRQLIKVSGIGPRIALAILATLTLEELHLAFDQADVAMLCRTPGIGKKVAERMLLELKGKFNVAIEFNADSLLRSSITYNVRNDVTNALLSLGFNDKEVNVVMKQMPQEITDLSRGIKEALKLLNNKH